jgi:hypothetical protein
MLSAVMWLVSCTTVAQKYIYGKVHKVPTRIAKIATQGKLVVHLTWIHVIKVTIILLWQISLDGGLDVIPIIT